MAGPSNDCNEGSPRKIDKCSGANGKEPSPFVPTRYRGEIPCKDKGKASPPPGGLSTFQEENHQEAKLTRSKARNLRRERLQIAAYEGDSDPLSHLDKYTSWMELQGASNAIMCRAFSLTLGDKAQRWFRRLHERSVKDWDDLATTFLAQFMGSKARTTPKERLVSIKQGRSKSLKSYLSRFNKQSMEVEKISNDAALMAVLAGLRPKMRFWWSVHEDGLRTYHEFLNRAEKYISTEEATFDQVEARREIDLNDVVKEKKPSRSPQPEIKKDRRERERPRAQPYKFREYHPLKASLEEVFTQANTKEAFRRPIVLKNEQVAQHQGRYCRYHRTMDHGTDNYRDLKKEVESLIR
ncbi:uncharacterized protein LOC111394231 [Olea europaea var. sylvestris]|uniref:uncharacterized protein LOC111394231 n=1 Tax=Olea europaea var. sylvestris TaxID=158386 RepID=UPI000C1D4225|nr:uncharacterized protein LOC111394231 [Olea europaea var. sylvestris]